MELIDLLQKGGWMMLPLAAGSVFVLAVAIERFLYFRVQETDIGVIMEALREPLRSGDWDAARAAAIGLGGAAAAIAAKGLEHAAHGPGPAEAAMDGAANIAAARLRDRLDYLDLMVTLAPLLGLLGTVLGMIRAFNILNIRAGQAMAITGGVGEALIATGAGLGVAITALVFLAYLRRRVDGLITGIEEVAAEVLTAVARRPA